MKKTRIFATLALLAALASSCTTPKQILYLQDIDEVDLTQVPTNYEATIKKDDKLVIIVSGPDKIVCGPYNLTIGEMTNGYSGGTNPEQSTLTYLVDSQGNIDFPILGSIHVEGMTRKELSNYITKEVGKDVKDPIVYVAFKNYKITILGEVKSPGTYEMDSEKINILQALGKAGDLQLTAQREGILIREVNGVEEHYRIDLKSAELLESPYFYLQQNDILYIPPSATRVATATTATGIWSVALSSITTTIALVSLIRK